MKKILSVLLVSTLMSVGLRPLPGASQPRSESPNFYIRISRVFTSESSDSNSATDFFAIIEPNSQDRLRTEVIRNNNNIYPGWDYRWTDSVYWPDDRNASSVRVRIYDRDRGRRNRDDLLIDEKIYLYPLPSNTDSCQFIAVNLRNSSDRQEGFGSLLSNGLPPCYRDFLITNEDTDTSMLISLQIY